MDLMLPPGVYVAGSKEYLIDECPNCGKHRHFYWNLDKKVGWCHVCQFRIVGVKQFLKAFSDSLEDRSGPSLVRQEGDRLGVLGRPAFWTNCAWDHPPARNFLITRKVTEEQARQIPISYVESEDSITVQIDSITPEFGESVIYRRFNLPGAKWLVLPGTDRSQYGFGIRHLRPGQKRIVLFEGTFDLLATGMLGCAIAILGTSLNDSWMAWLRKRGFEVVLWLDPDAAGERGAQKLKSRLRTWEIPCRTYKHPVDPKLLGSEHPAVLHLKSYLGVPA